VRSASPSQLTLPVLSCLPDREILVAAEARPEVSPRPPDGGTIHVHAVEFALAGRTPAFFPDSHQSAILDPTPDPEEHL
jgi:hypothetical protein